MSITLHFEFHPPACLRGNSRSHWAQRHRASTELQESTYVRLLEHTKPDWDQIRLRYRLAYCGRPLDDDNFIIGMKPIRDEICDWLGIDDGPDHVVDTSVEYERVKHRTQRACSVTIEEAIND